MISMYLSLKRRVKISIIPKISILPQHSGYRKSDLWVGEECTRYEILYLYIYIYVLRFQIIDTRFRRTGMEISFYYPDWKYLDMDSIWKHAVAAAVAVAVRAHVVISRSIEQTNGRFLSCRQCTIAPFYNDREHFFAIVFIVSFESVLLLIQRDKSHMSLHIFNWMFCQMVLLTRLHSRKWCFFNDSIYWHKYYVLS